MRNGRNHSSRNITFPLILIAALYSHLSNAQKITNVDFEVIGHTVKVTYDLGGCSGDQNYDVKLSVGKDGELREVVRGLSGDLKKVTCGSSNTITWDVLSDRNELKGRIYFVVEIQRTHDVVRETQTTHEKTSGKAWSRRSWKADKGYVGGSLGVFTPYESYLRKPYGAEQNGLFLNTTIGYLPTLVFGVCSTVYIYGMPRANELGRAVWSNYGIMIGPLISFPIGNKIKWELRPQVGYSFIYAKSDLPDLDSLGVATSGVVYNLGTGLRLNLGKRTCYLLNLEYMSSPRKPQDYYHYRFEPELGTVGVSIGVAFRFY